MEPATLIVAALVAGAGASDGHAAGSAIAAAHAELRTFLVTHLQQREAALSALAEVEAEAAQAGPEHVNPSWRAVLISELDLVGAGQDQTLLAYAQQMLFLLDPDNARAGTYVLPDIGESGDG